ncbi:unnamed protein product [Vitrella brassicaformis CCMP3155]|uniref:Uncharacterized protein n=1 Tax=Vitrella brassicaformis (strain CCMP3155) TaxID=1169540 RepID=A0A0G4H4C0_VITBC|nr:unnamed protein product [Vitrella brassicaformis CCMP3155]|eukprot:CEM38616.1 unnamed protein product [Vitrella brassicaformis CCMP3155]
MEIRKRKNEEYLKRKEEGEKEAKAAKTTTGAAHPARRRSSSNGRRARRRCSSRSVWCVSPSRPSSSSSRTWIHAKTKKTSEQTQKIEGQVLDAKSRILILKNQIDQERKNCQAAKEAHDSARAHLKQLKADKHQLDEAKAKLTDRARGIFLPELFSCLW